MVNLAGRTFLYGLLKFKVDSVAKLFCDLLPTLLNFRSKNLKLSFTLNYELKRTSDLKQFQLNRFAFEVRQKFEAVPGE